MSDDSSQQYVYLQLRLKEANIEEGYFLPLETATAVWAQIKDAMLEKRDAIVEFGSVPYVLGEDKHGKVSHLLRTNAVAHARIDWP